MIYLASPYSHPDPAVEAFRFEAVCQASADLMLSGHTIVSPIAHSHPIYVRRPDVGGSFEQWYDLDRTLISASDELWVLTLDGWQESHGVTEEIKIANELGKPIRYIDRKGI